MSITEISVKRPAAITMVVLLLIGFGVLGYTNLGASLFPSMSIPVITISDTYGGASAEDIKEDIIKPIEDAVSGISGVNTIDSTSQEGTGNVMIEFKDGTDINSAFLDVQKAVSNAQGKLPSEASTPVISKMNSDDMPVMTLAISGTASPDELYNEADKIKTQLEKVTGVGQVSLGGADKKQVMIKLDKPAVEYYGVNVSSILSKLKSENASTPAGQIKQDKVDKSVRAIGEFQSIDEVKNLLVSTNNGGTVRLGDIADVKLETPDVTSETKLNGKKTISLDVKKQSDANVVEVVNNIKEEINTLQKTMPKNMSIITASDTTVFIKDSLSEIKHSLIEGIITTAIVLLFFLKSWRSSLVVLVAIPTSLIATFFMMYKLKFTLNMMSLMALSLCIGILVDDSIVVLENIQRHLAQGKNPIRAAIEGRKEIGMAAVAITLCDVVVFAPIAFMSGIVGEYFRQFGLTIVCATLFSLFISFTATPMLASRFFKPKAEGAEGSLKKYKNGVIQKLSGKFNKFMEKVTESYKKILLWSLDNRGKVLVGLVACIIASVALIPLGFVGTEFMSNSDQSSFSISASLTPGSSLKETDDKAVQLENYLKTIKEVKYYYTQVSDASIKVDVTLVPKSQRKKTQTQLASQVRNWGKTKLTGVDFSVSESQMGGGEGLNSSSAISVKISGDNEDTLKDLSKKVQEEIKLVSGTTDISSSLDADDSEIRVKIDKLAAAQYGVSTSDIESTLRTCLQGSSAGTYRGDPDSEYDITLKFADGQVKSAADIGSIKIQNSSSQQISLDQVASIVEADSAKSISREDRQDVVTVSANIEGRDLGSVNIDIKNRISAMSIPVGYSVSYGGSQKQMGDTFSTLIKAIIASIVLVYMILVVLYESFLTPLVRMLALPCAIIGALVILALTRNTINMMSLIGFIMLDGLASKNGTLLIDYTNTLKKQGMGLKEALIVAGTTRLRPIIMTSLTMVVGMLPSALAIGEGSETRAGMAWVIIGGMIASTILSPIILPVVYTLMDDFKHWIFRNRNRKSYVTEGN